MKERNLCRRQYGSHQKIPVPTGIAWSVISLLLPRMGGTWKVVHAVSFVNPITKKGRFQMDYIDAKIEKMFGKNEKVTPEKWKHYEERFFAKAHEFFYGSTPDMRIEIAQYHRGVISSTMMRYVQHLMKEEADGKARKENAS